MRKAHSETSGCSAGLLHREREGSQALQEHRNSRRDQEAAARGAEITAELNRQELTITAQEPVNMEAAFNVTGDRRKMLVEAVSAFVGAPAVYQNAPTFAYAIGEYAVSKTGTLTGPANEALMTALNAKGFIVE